MYKLSKEVEEIKDYLVKTRRYLHQNPESSLKEYKTSKFIKEELDSFGVSYISVGETGVLGEIQGKEKGPTILLRADMDALEIEDKKEVEYASKNKGLCHACGHDGHTAALLGAAKILNQNKDKINGKVKLVYQQAEEVGKGAIQFLQAGHLKDVDFAFGVHLASAIRLGQVTAVEGPFYASCDIFEIDVIGKASHASTPHLGKDAALAVSAIVNGLQNIISRQKDPFDPAVISIGYIQAGSRYNIIANDGVIKGTLRSLDTVKRIQKLEQIEKVAKLIAEANNCKAIFKNTLAAPILINDSEITKYSQYVLKDIVGEENIITKAQAKLGAEDFAVFAENVPSTFLNVGTSSSEATSQSHHSQLFDIDEEGLFIACQTHVDIVLRAGEYFK